VSDWKKTLELPGFLIGGFDRVLECRCQQSKSVDDLAVEAAQSHPKATPRPADSQLIATLKRLQGSHKAPTKPGDGPREANAEGRRQNAEWWLCWI
jgi:hypothetical protein